MQETTSDSQATTGGSHLLRSLPSPEPAAGAKAYADERERALAFSEKRRENFARFQASDRRSAKVDYLPVVMDVENVSRCNFRCVMCLTNDFTKGKRAVDMTLDEFKRLIDEQYGLVEIKLHGIGEPLLQGETFFEMVRYARAQYIWVRTVTNASLLHARNNYQKLIDTDINEVQISIDGADKETFEGIRRLSNFERVTENCKLINAYCKEQKKDRTKMWTVVQDANQHQLENLVELAAELGFTNQVFSLQVWSWGSDELASRTKEINVDKELSHERLLRLVDMGEDLGVKVSFWNITEKYSAETKQQLCPWPFERAYIGSDSRTVPCSMLGNPDLYELGKGKSFVDAWLSDEYTAFRQAHIDGCPPKACESCYKIKRSPQTFRQLK